MLSLPQQQPTWPRSRIPKRYGQIARWAIAMLVVSSGNEVPSQIICGSRLPSLPIAISNNAVTSVVGADGTTSVYSFMGIQNGTLGSITPASFRLDLPSGTWQAIADAPLLDGRAKIGANALTVRGEVYLIGGYTATSNLEVTEERMFRYDAVQDTYVELAPVPVEVDDTVAAVYQDRYIFLASGWHGPSNRNVRNVQVYDTETNAWSQATRFPGPSRGVFGHSGTIVGDQLVFFDGAFSTGGFPISSEVLIGQIDPEQTGDVTNIAWQRISPHPGDPTYRAAASQGPAVDNQLLVLGGTNNPYNYSGVGYNGQAASPLEQALTFDVITQEWRVLPQRGESLTTMDHRGLVAVFGGWASVGGMLAPHTATDAVVHYRFEDDASACLVPEPDGMLLAVATCLSGLGIVCRRRSAWKSHPTEGPDRAHASQAGSSVAAV